MKYASYFAAFVVCLTLFGCGGPKTVVYDQPSLIVSDHYETVWVDPQIMFSDSLVTVIRAARLDSVRLSSVPPEQGRVARIGFQIVSDECNVVVSLADTSGRTLRPLFIQNLSPGYYQLTLNHPLSLDEIRPLRRYLLKADYCGIQLVVPFISSR